MCNSVGKNRFQTGPPKTPKNPQKGPDTPILGIKRPKFDPKIGSRTYGAKFREKCQKPEKGLFL
jgi:hypothetical protein